MGQRIARDLAGALDIAGNKSNREVRLIVLGRRKKLHPISHKASSICLHFVSQFKIRNLKKKCFHERSLQSIKRVALKLDH